MPYISCDIVNQIDEVHVRHLGVIFNIINYVLVTSHVR